MARSADLERGGPAAGLAACVVAATALAVSAAGVFRNEPLPLLILLAAIVLPWAAFVFVQALNWNPPYAFAVGVTIVVLQCATLRIRGIDDKSIDWQILMRLACIGAMLALGVSALHGRATEDRHALLPWAVFFIYFAGTSFIAVHPGISFVETLSNAAALLFLYGFAHRLGAHSLVRLVIGGCFILCCASLVAYAIDPALGRMQDWSNGALVSTWRLTGVFGAANGAGAAGAIGLLFMILLSGLPWRTPLFFLLATPMAACLLLSDNRMSMVGLGAGLVYVWFARGNLGLKLAGAVLLAGVGVLLMTGFGDLILSSLSRSGSIQEIETATGRTRIWAVAFHLWTLQPLFGYGGGSAKFILPVHPLLFKAAAHAHDLYLNVLFEGGAVGLAIFLWGLGAALRRVWRRRAHALMGILVFFLLYGITEPMIEGVTSFAPLGFYALLVLSIFPTVLHDHGSPRAAPHARKGLTMNVRPAE